MKIVTNEKGQKVVEFEVGDAELKANFFALMQAQEGMRQDIMRLDKEHDAVCRKLSAAKKRLDAWRDENHDTIWDPINEALQKGGNEAHGLSFDFDTQELSVVDEPERPQLRIGSMPKSLASLLGALGAVPAKPDSDDDDDGTRH